MVSVPHFEFVGCHSNIFLCFCVVCCCYTSALYNTLVAKQFSGIGHSSFLRQLHLFCVGTLLGFVFERMWVLCVLMAAFMFGMQL